MAPFFIITIDTEGDNLWDRPHTITTHNSKYLLRFQDLCDKYKLKPTYLVDYEMASCPDFVKFGKNVIKDQRAEIGMHLHAWNSPPIVPLTSDDYIYQPYLIEYPETVIVDKVKFMTNLLEDTFGLKMLSHRAGRWAFNAFYSNTLMNLGYKVDCSVTPYVSWENEKGKPDGNGGTDFSGFPRKAYFMDTKNISKACDKGLLEVPVTVMRESSIFKVRYIKKTLHPKLIFRNKGNASRYWLRPNGRNVDDMLKIIQHILSKGIMYAEFMIHSSELMPGGSPHFKNESAIDKLYDDLEQLFSATVNKFNAATLAEFHDWFSAENRR